MRHQPLPSLPFALPFALTWALALPAAALAEQQVLQVPSEYPTIQAALDAAPPGAMVKVAPGIFHEHVQLREDVDLVGSGWRKTVIDAGGTGDVTSADGVHKFLLRGLALRGSGPGGRGLSVNGATSFTFGVTARVEFCRITDNGYGIQVSNVHSGILEIRKNVIDRNGLDAVDPFIGTTVLERNTIVGNGGSGFTATDGGGQNFLTSNAIAANGGYGVYRTIGTPLTASYNDVFGNLLGDYVQDSGGLPVTFIPVPGTSEQTSNPGFYSLENGDYALVPGSPLIDAGDPSLGLELDGTPVDVGAFSFSPIYTPASSAFGQGCGPQAGWFWEPIIGQPYYEVSVSGAPPGAPALLEIGVSQSAWSGLPLPLDLGPFGAPGCSLLTGPVVSFSAAADLAGHAQLNLALPSSAALAGAVFYMQWVIPAPGANPLGLLLSDGVTGTIKL